jgi:hypothetical protein
VDSSAENSPAFDAIIAGKDPGDAFRVNFVLLGKNPSRERFDSVAVEHGDSRLLPDWTAVQIFVDKVDRAAGDFHTMDQRLILCIEARESGQERGMDVENPSGESPDEVPAQQPHVTGQTNQVNPMLPEQFGYLGIESGPVPAGGIDGAARQAELASMSQAERLRFIRKNEANFAIELPFPDIAGNGGEV